MADENYKRKLTAILSADVAGYSRLMGDDEVATVITLKSHRNLISDKVQEFNGRVVDSPGDNLLAEFRSIVDAVSCAVAIQEGLQVENDELPENRKMMFRIGVNLGDVIQDEDRIYGDGVNIAARVEGLADPGGIAISGTAFDNIRNKLDCGYQFSGEHAVKNIANPVRVYKILTNPECAGKVIGEKRFLGWMSRKIAVASILSSAIIIGGLVSYNIYLHQSGRIEPVSVEKVASPISEKASIAVMPFDNMSNDPDQAYFGDGISEDLITDLSKISNLLVISRLSSFTYKGKNIKVQQIAEELGVRYVLEGSVRKAENRVRINAQLIDAASGHHLWADRYDGDMNDIFALQDKITRKIISALALKLTASEQKALTDKETDNLQAYDEFLKGWQGYRLLTKAGFAEAKIHLEKSVELDPEFARAYAALAVLYWKAIQIASHELREGLGINNRAARNAVRNKPHFLVKKAMVKPTALAHGLMSQFYLFRYQHDEALSEIEQAVAMDPNDPELYAWMSHILWLIGKNKEAIESAKMGLRLDPNNPTAYLIQQAKAYLPDGNLEESLLLLERAKRLNPDLSGSISLTESIIYGIQGRDEEARIAYGLLVKSRHTPVRNLNDILLYIPFADPKKLDRIAVALIKAGVPGKPTDYYRIFKENRIDGQAVKELLFGKKITGTAMSTGKQYWWEWDKNGKFKLDMQVFKDTGKSWVERDICFIQFDKFLGGLPYGTVIYRNPDGSMESQNQYLMVSDTGSITPFAPIE
jgi:TolB-like protein/class 3 adenylate cyclase